MSTKDELLVISRNSFGAAYIGCVFYGIYVLLAGICMHYLLESWRSKTATTRRVLTAYTVAMFVVTTIYFVSSAKWSEIEFIEDSNNSGSFAVQTSNLLAIMKDASITVNIWLADSLILYRAFVIWNNQRWIMVFPMLIYLADLATGTALLVVTGEPGAHFGISQVVSLGTAFWSISVSLNVVSTLLISGRLLYHRHQVRHIRSAGSQVHTSVVVVLVESAALYSISGLVYIPLYAADTAGQFPLAALFCAISSIAPNLIVLRMALGVAVTTRSLSTTQATATISFPPATLPRSQISNGSTAYIGPFATKTQSVEASHGSITDAYELDTVKERTTGGTV